MNDYVSSSIVETSFERSRRSLRLSVSFFSPEVLRIVMPSAVSCENRAARTRCRASKRKERKERTFRYAPCVRETDAKAEARASSSPRRLLLTHRTGSKTKRNRTVEGPRGNEGLASTKGAPSRCPTRIRFTRSAMPRRRLPDASFRIDRPGRRMDGLVSRLVGSRGARAGRGARRSIERRIVPCLVVVFACGRRALP